MPEHYSHIRIDVKRQALEALDVQRARAVPETANGDGKDGRIDAIVEVPGSVTIASQSGFAGLATFR